MTRNYVEINNYFDSHILSVGLKRRMGLFYQLNVRDK